MISTSLLSSAVVAAFILCTNAFPTYVRLLPNSDASTRDGSGITCLYLGHQNCIPGAPRNQFGLDFARFGRTWNKQLCETDSDGDGLTNGEELGDPCCTWMPGDEPLRRNMLSHPGQSDQTNTAPKCNAPDPSMSMQPKPSMSMSMKPKPSMSNSMKPKPSMSMSMKPKPSMSMKPMPSKTKKPMPSMSKKPMPSMSKKPMPSMSKKPMPSMTKKPMPSTMPPSGKTCRSGFMSPFTQLRCDTVTKPGMGYMFNIQGKPVKLVVRLRSTKFQFMFDTMTEDLKIRAYALSVNTMDKPGPVVNFMSLQMPQKKFTKAAPMSVLNLPLPQNMKTCCWADKVFIKFNLQFTLKRMDGSMLNGRTGTRMLKGRVPCINQNKFCTDPAKTFMPMSMNNPCPTCM